LCQTLCQTFFHCAKLFPVPNFSLCQTFFTPLRVAPYLPLITILNVSNYFFIIFYLILLLFTLNICLFLLIFLEFSYFIFFFSCIFKGLRPPSGSAPYMLLNVLPNIPLLFPSPSSIFYYFTHYDIYSFNK
jgi:hypothetical protein